VNIEHPDAEPGRFNYGFGNRIRDIVVFKIEKYSVVRCYFANKRGTGSCEKLQADLERSGIGSELRDYVASLIRRFDVEGDYNALFRFHC
jgi:hypothetical protein